VTTLVRNDNVAVRKRSKQVAQTCPIDAGSSVKGYDRWLARPSRAPSMLSGAAERDPANAGLPPLDSLATAVHRWSLPDGRAEVPLGADRESR
jgi:hypothetical protein